MNQLSIFIDKLVEFPTIFPAVLAITATMLMLLSIIISIDHLFADAWHFDVDHDHSMETSFSNNFIAFLGLKRRIPLVPLIALITWGMTLTCLFITSFVDLSSSWWRIILGILLLVVLLPVFSRIAYLLMLPLAKLIENNSGKEYTLIGKFGYVSSINQDESYVTIEIKNEGIDSSVIVFVDISEINKIEPGDKVLIVKKELNKENNSYYYHGGKIN